MENPNKNPDAVILQKQNAVAQASQDKQSILEFVSNDIATSLTPESPILNSLNQEDIQGTNLPSIFDIADESKRRTDLFIGEKNYTNTDVAKDSVVGAAKGTVNLLGGTFGGANLLGANPVEGVSNAVDTVGEALSDFTGTDALRGLGDSIRETFAKAEANTRQFYKDNGLEWAEDTAVFLKENLIEPRAELNETIGSTILEGTSKVSEFIGEGQNKVLQMKAEDRQIKNQAYADRIKTELGEDAAIWETALANTKIGLNAAGQLIDDPAAATVVISESLPSMVGSGIAAKVATNSAYKTAQAKFAKEVREKGLKGDDAKLAIQQQLQTTFDAEKIGASAAAKSGAVFEAAGASSETYNLIIGTPVETLAKTSERYQELVQTMEPEEAREQLAIESAQGAGVAMLATGLGIAKLTNVGEGVSRAAGVSKTKDGVVPRAWEITKDAMKEGIEETLQSFTSSVITGIEERENVDATLDVYEKAAIASGEGAVAGVGMSAAGSSLRTSADLLKYANESAREAREEIAKSNKVPEDIKENGLNKEVLDTTSEDFDYIGVLRGIQERNKQEAITPEESEYIIEEAKNATAEFATRISMQEKTLTEGLSSGEINQEEAKTIQQQLDKDKEDLQKGESFLQALVYEQRENIGSDVEGDITKAVESKDTAATERVMGNMRNDLNSVSASQAKKLLEAETLTPEQTKEVESFIKLKTVAEVNQEVLVGKNGNIGLQQYLNSISANINLNRPEQAEKSLEMLGTFADRHGQKAMDFREALDIAQLGNQATAEQLARKEEIESKYLTQAGNPIRISAGSETNLVIPVEQEAVALSAGYELGQAQLAQMTSEAPKQQETEQSTNSTPNVETQSQQRPQDAGATPTTTPTPTETPVGSGIVVKSMDEVFTDAPWEDSINAKSLLDVVAKDNVLGAAKEVNNLVRSAVSPDLKVTMVPSTSDKLITHKDGSKALGTYDHSDGTIYVMNNISSPELQSEVILHEVIHSLTWGATDKSNPNRTAAQKKFAVQVTNLYNKTLTQVKKDGLENEYAVSDINEFLTMGISNQEFMTYLNKIPAGNSTVFKKFIQAISQLLGKSDPNTISVLEDLLGTTSEFFNNDFDIEAKKEPVPDRSLEERTIREGTQGELFDAPPLASTTEARESTPEVETTQKELEDAGQESLGLFNFAESITQPGEPQQINEDGEIEYEVQADRDFYSENHLEKNFEPTVREGASSNPIVTVSDPMSKLDQDPVKFITSNSTVEEPTGKQVNLIKDLSKFNKEFKNTLNSIFQVGKRKNMDMIAHFANENGILPENLIAAMSVATYDWIATKGSASLYNSDETIREMAGLDKEDPITQEIKDAYREGNVRNAVSELIGAKIYKSLGIKSKTTAPGNMQSLLENSLGQWAVATMIKQGLVNVREVDNFRSEDEFKKINMITVKSVDNDKGFPEPHVDIKRFMDMFTDSKGIVEKVFKTESFKKVPVFTPVRGVPNKVKGTNQNLSKKTSEAVKAENNRGFRMKVAQMGVFNSMSDSAKRKMLGYNDNLDAAHIANRDSYEGQNRDINRSINDVKEFSDSISDLDTPFYFSFYTIKNGRLMIDSNTVNPLTNKLHRHLIVKEGQEQTVKFNNKDSVDAFMMAVAQSMGVKIDKQLIQTSLDEVASLMNEPEIKKAVDMLRTHASLENFSEEQENTLLTAIKKGGEKTWSLDGLVAYAGYLNAKELGQDFTHDLAIEADGVTNGPAIGTWQFGIGSGIKDIVMRFKKVGINVAGDTQEYGDYISNPTAWDNYETITKLVDKALGDMVISPKKRKLFALLFPDLVEVKEDGSIKVDRNISKNPLMTTIYGASGNSIKETLAEAALSTVYDYMEEYANDPAQIKALVNVLNESLGTSYDPEAVAKDPLNLTLDFAGELSLKKAVEGTYGNAMVAAIDEAYGEFKDKTKAINSLMGTVATTFNDMFDDAVSRRTEELVEQGVLALSKEGSPLETLPKPEVDKILEDLLESQPIMQSVFSSQAGDITSEGLYVGKIKKVTAVNETAYQSRSNPKGMKELTMFGSKTSYESGGVAPVVLAVQNIDSATMLSHLLKYNSMNVHDAIIINADGSKERVGDMNKNFTNINMSHSIATEAMKAYDRATEAAKAYDESNGTSFADTFYNEDIQDITMEINRINADKDNNQSMITGVSQYYWEGARHLVKNTTLKIKDLTDAADKTNTPDSFAEEVVKKKSGYPDREFGSNENVGTDDFKTDTQKTVDSLSVLGVFKELGKVGNIKETVEHARYLAESINVLKAQITEPLKLKLADKSGDTMANITGNDIFMYTQFVGGAKGSTAILNSGLRMSAQEAFAHELWHSVSRDGIDSPSYDSAQLERIWLKAKKEIPKTVFMDDPTKGTDTAEYKESAEAWEYIFTPRTDFVKDVTNAAGNKVSREYSNHLHEFVAYAMTNAKFIEALKEVSPERVRQPQLKENPETVLDTVSNWVKDKMFYLLDLFSQKMTNTNDLSTDLAVQRLAMNVSNIEAQHKNILMVATETIGKGYDLGSSLIGSAAKVIATPLVKFSESKFAKESGNVLVRLPGTAIRLASKSEYVGLALEKLDQVRQRNSTTMQGMAEHILSEAKGLTSSNSTAHTLVNLRKKVVDSAVTETESSMKTILKNVFEDQELSEEQLTAMTKVILKTDLTSLGLNLNSLTQLVSNPALVDREINKLTNRLSSSEFFGHFDTQAKALGWYMVTGEVKADNLNFNAKQIANLYGLNISKKNANARKDEPVLDALASLYALKYTSQEYKDIMEDVMKTSLAKGPDNGVEAFLKLHKDMKKNDREQRFKGSESNIVKGYVQDDTSGDIETLIATVDEGKDLETKGWIKVYDLPKDKDDVTNVNRALYVNRFGGETTLVSGAMSLTSTKAAGSDTILLQRVEGSDTPRADGSRKAKKIARDKAVKANKHLRNRGTFDPSKAPTVMAPLYDLKGNVTGYRYMMTEKTKDNVLKRNNNAFDVMAKQAGRTVNIVNSNQLNNQAIEALKEQYDATKNDGGFIYVSPTSNDPEIREMYAMLPEPAKAHIRKVWGTDGMFVNREVYTIIFGYRKFSAADAMEQNDGQANFVMEGLSMAMNFIAKPFNMTGSQLTKVLGNEWQAYVREFKNVLIVKSGLVTAINSLSNSTQLLFSGLSFKDMIKYQKEAYVEAFKYRRDMAELRELEKMVEIGYRPSQRAEQKAQIAFLRNKIANNPASNLIEDGLLQTIVEDVELIESDSRVQSFTEEQINKYSSKLPGWVRKGASEVFMTQGSKMYKYASEAAQLSDFVSRYALYQHNTKNGMGHTDAINESMNEFVNYNIPTHRNLQYANDMGFVWFSTYFIRIQRILAKRLVENPNRVITGIVLNMMLGGGIPSMYDSAISPDNIANRVMLPGNPLDMVSNIGTLQPMM